MKVTVNLIIKIAMIIRTRLRNTVDVLATDGHLIHNYFLVFCFVQCEM